MRAGEDPSAERQALRGVPTVKELTERYMQEHCLVHNEPTSAIRNRYILKNHIVPKLGRLKVAEVTRPEVAELISAMRKTPTAANRTLATLRKMFNLAELWGWRPDGTKARVSNLMGIHKALKIVFSEAPRGCLDQGAERRIRREVRARRDARWGADRPHARAALPRRGAWWLVIDPASVPTASISCAARRIIRSLYPPIDLFEDIADPEDWPLLIAAEQKTNPRLMETLGALDLVPPDRRVAGPGATYIMAPFTHVSPDRPSRFTRGDFGVLHVAERFETALLETMYHHARFMARTAEPPGWTSQFRELVLDVPPTSTTCAVEPQPWTPRSTQTVTRRLRTSRRRSGQAARKVSFILASAISAGSALGSSIPTAPQT